MTNPLGPGDVGAFGIEIPSKLLTAEVLAPAPASAGSPLYVKIISFGPDRWGPCPFMPRGSALPSVGTTALVALDEEGNPWVVCWT